MYGDMCNGTTASSEIEMKSICLYTIKIILKMERKEEEEALKRDGHVAFI